jgi:hypothetical protein
MHRIETTVTNSTLAAQGYKQGTVRKWHCWSKTEVDIYSVIDQLSVISKTAHPDASGNGGQMNLPLTLNNEIQTNVILSLPKRGFSLLASTPVRKMFHGAVLLQAADFPTALPLAYVYRGGMFSAKEEILLLKIETDFVPLPTFIKSLTGTPDDFCRAIWREMGNLLGDLHSKGIVVGIEKPEQLLVKREGKNARFQLVAGKNFQFNPVLGFLRQCEDIIGANFVFSPAIAPLDRLRFIEKYAELMKWSDFVLRENMSMIADLTRQKAAKEWKVFPANLPKKTSLLNLIRALDTISQR